MGEGFAVEFVISFPAAQVVSQTPVSCTCLVLTVNILAHISLAVLWT